MKKNNKINRIGMTLKGSKFIKPGESVRFFVDGFNEIEGEYVGDNVLRGTSVTFNPEPVMAEVIDLAPFSKYEFVVVEKPAWLNK